MTEPSAADFERSLRILSETIREQGATGEKLAEALWRVYESVSGIKTSDAALTTLLNSAKDQITQVLRDLDGNARDHKTMEEKIDRVRTDVMGRLVEIHTFIARYESQNGPDGVKEALRDLLTETTDARKELFRTAVRETLCEEGVALVIQKYVRTAIVEQHTEEDRVADEEAAAGTGDKGKVMLPYFRILVLGVVIAFLALVWALVMREKDGGSLKVDKNGVVLEAGKKAQEFK